MPPQPTTADDTQVNLTPGTVQGVPTGDVIEGATQGSGFSIDVPDTLPASLMQPGATLGEAERRRQERLQEQLQQTQQGLSQIRQQNQQLQQQLIEAQTPERVQQLRGQLADVQGQFTQEREALRSEPGQTMGSFEARLSPIQRQATAEEQAISNQLSAAQQEAKNRISSLSTALQFNEQQRQNLISMRDQIQEAAEIPSELQEASQANAILGLVEQGVTDPSRLFNFLNFNEQGEQVGGVSLDRINNVLSAVQGEDELLSVNEAARLGVPFGTTVQEASQQGITPTFGSGGGGTGGGTPQLGEGETFTTVLDEVIANRPDASVTEIRNEVERRTGSRPLASEVSNRREQSQGQQQFSPESVRSRIVERAQASNMQSIFTRDEAEQQILAQLANSLGVDTENVPTRLRQAAQQAVNDIYGEETGFWEATANRFQRGVSNIKSFFGG